MTHGEANSRFEAYFAGTLGRDEVRGFNQHLKDCDACRARMRLQNAAGKAAANPLTHMLASPETQAAMARNRDLLVKILLLLVFGWAVSRLRH